jgi:hypothetical protein
MRLFRNAWLQLKDFSALGGNATYLWPRWIVLRAVGFVYIIIFAGIIDEGRALIGPGGIAPIAEFCEALRKIFPNAIERTIRAPSLFWLSSSPGAIAVLEWGGLAAAVALVLNLWPRMALFACWLFFLSFVSTWGIFTASIDDQLMLETALLCIAFAPAGLRPGLGAPSPPRPIAVFAMRWLLFRVMFESGVIKLTGADIHWRDLTAMQVMDETSPLPTIFGYLDHLLPNAFHLLEIALTFAAEIAAPLLALFAGRRGRWLALAIWVAFQGGIELTTSFGWLNTASIALGLVLLDDQMLAGAAGRLRLRWLANALAPAGGSVRAATPWRLYGLRALLGAHFCLTLYFFGTVLAGKSLIDIPHFKSRPVEFLFRDFESANAYIPYASFPPHKIEVEFQGSNDGGKTWRTYDFRFKPQRPDRICPFVAPWFDRFEATLQLAVNIPGSTVIPRVAAQLVLGNPDVVGLFRRNPFPGGPPTAVRMPVYQFSFTDYQTFRKTGHYWAKTYEGDYVPVVYLSKRGHVVEGK